ncbi:hypothetical protein MNBD_NITROSPINAE03-700 [hydrothermal vent metagenome]|uniref:Glycosyl transferase, group 1 n=1 Tax=hydrothermal vent metagenome TaxID=652676 RepID=A0A3B1C2A7_9ZZZZ
MKIGLDIRTINKPKSGVGYYVTNLIREFQSIDATNEYFMISNNHSYESEFRNLSNFTNFKTWISNENHIIGDLWESFYLPRLLLNKNVDVFHGPAFMIPLRSVGFRTVVTIHDVVAFTRTETVPKKYALYMRILLKQVVRKVDKIIAPSISTKNDLIKYLNTPEEKIHVVYNAVSPKYSPAAPGHDYGEIKRKFGIRNKYILFAGNLEPRKNLIRLMEAFNMALPKLSGEYQLVICGKRGWLYQDILRTYEKFNLNNEIILTNYVTEQDLINLYQSADIFAFPTLYEGFGFPPLEAMGCGVPVITSNVSSLPEIVGDAAVLVNPLDTGEISEALVTMASSEALREELKEKGLKRSALFSWKDTARKTLDIYASVF